MSNLNLNLVWLYPDLMNTYGDRGNILSFLYRTKKRKIDLKIITVSLKDSSDLILQADFLFMGGAQDTQQEIVNKDLFSKKGRFLKEMIEKEIPGLYICGGYQFLGRFYKTSDGKILPGLEIFDIYTESPKTQTKRLIGDLIIKSDLFPNKYLIGFENHNGRTYLGKKVRPLGKVIFGGGNNGRDLTEGMIYKNSIGSYMHGPILPKNPELTDFLIEKALEIKYKKKIKLKKINDDFEKKAKKQVLRKLNIKLNIK